MRVKAVESKSVEGCDKVSNKERLVSDGRAENEMAKAMERSEIGILVIVREGVVTELDTSMKGGGGGRLCTRKTTQAVIRQGKACWKNVMNREDASRVDCKLGMYIVEECLRLKIQNYLLHRDIKWASQYFPHSTSKVSNMTRRGGGQIPCSCNVFIKGRVSICNCMYEHLGVDRWDEVSIYRIVWSTNKYSY